MEYGDKAYVLINDSYGEVVVVTSSMEYMIPHLREELNTYSELSEEDVERMIKENDYGEYFTIDYGIFMDQS